MVLSFFLLFGLFSVNANASDVNILSNDINFRFFSLDEYPGIPKQFGHTPYVKNSDLPLNFDYNLYNLFNRFPDGNFLHYDIFDFAYIKADKINTTELYYGDKIILNKGENFKASVSVVGSYFLAKNRDGFIVNQFPLYQNNSFNIYFDLYDGSGNTVSVEAEDFEINLKEYNNGNYGTAAYYNISASFSDVPFDVYGIRLITASNAMESFGGNMATDFNSSYYKTDVLNGNVSIYRYVNVDSFSLVVDDSNKNLLNTIIGWLSNIKDNLTSGLSNVSNGLTNLGNRINSFFTNLGNTITTNFNSLTTNFKNNITSLGDRFSGFITSLGDRISGFFNNLTSSINGFFIKLVDDIKGLFIPSEDYFENLSNSFRDIAEDRFGALFTVVDFIDSFLFSFDADKTTEFIDIPVYQFDIFGYPFLFGGWRFRFIPDYPIIHDLVDIAKGVSNIIITFTFIGGLKSRYDEIFGGD